MDLKKVFDQTVRELKREVNKKVLKVPEIEVKILEATSNEPWGPTGTIMGDIAQATRNFNDYQMIMTVLYKRLNDTGRNWRHVYKALTVLEYLVANGAERVIDELQEHTYQIQTLCDFQYLEASGKDQGINVRKKAQTLVALIKDKDRIREVRSKAAANRDKYRGVSSTGMTHRSSSYNSTGGGYGDRDRDDDRDRYGGSRGGRDEYDYTGTNSGRDTDRYRDDDSYGRDRERNRDSGYDRPRDRDASKEREAYGSTKGGSKGADEYGSRGSEKYESSPSSNRDRSYDDDDSFSSRNGKAKGGSTPPPAYEEAVQRAPADEDRDESSGVAAAVARAQYSQVEAPVDTAPEPVTKTNGGGSYFASQAADDDFDDFDPRGTFTATPAPAASQPTENFFPDSATPSFFPESTPAPAPAPAPAPPAAPKALGGLEDLFGDVSFGAAPAPAPFGDVSFGAAPAPAPSSSNFTNTPVQSNDLFGDSFLATQPSDAFGASAFAAPPAPAPVAAPADPFGGSSFTLAPPPPPPAYQPQAPAPPPPPPAYQPQAPAPPPPAYSGYGAANGNGLNGNMYGQSATPFDSGFSGQGFNNNNNNHQTHTRHQSFGDPFGAPPPQASNSLNRSASVPLPPQQPAKKEFGPVKSAIWGDTLSMGLVDLNIAGPKVNPLNDLGIQLTDPTLKNELWGADNPKQQQKKTTSSPGMGMGASMGKAMGSGSGLGRAGASALPPPMPSMRPPMGPGMGMGMGMGPQMGMNFNMGMGMNPGMGVSPGMGMGMGMGMGPQMGMGMNQMPPGYPNQQQQQYNGYR